MGLRRDRIAVTLMVQVVVDDGAAVTGVLCPDSRDGPAKTPCEAATILGPLAGVLTEA